MAFFGAAGGGGPDEFGRQWPLGGYPGVAGGLNQHLGVLGDDDILSEGEGDVLEVGGAQPV